ncbi:MAG: hypothetical protein R3B09_09745 [Nannocystaceae bacterium]
MLRRAAAATPLLFALTLAACTGTSAETEGDTDTAGTDTQSGTDSETTGPDLTCEGAMIPSFSEASCTPLASDYQPRVNSSADDTWAACISDDDAYHLVEGTPGSQARIVAYEKIADLLWRNGTPDAAAFTEARDQYVIPEGLESRVVRREDLHYDAIPMSEWDPQVDGDKQCTVTANVTKYPDRCVGPSKMSPILVEAFDMGQQGMGDADVLAAKIEATLLWFIYASVYKEANTCATEVGKDCDSAWAYYTGGQDMAGGLGMAKVVLGESAESHARIWDGILAVRCWRDLYSEGGTYPLLPDIDQAGNDLFNQGWEQLDQALHRGFALVVRERMERMFQNRCNGATTKTDWAFLQIAGPALSREANARGAADGAKLDALWAMDNPTAQDLVDGVTTLDGIFPCG